MIASSCTCTRLRRAARTMTHLYDAALAPAGITVAQFSLMRNVIRLAEPHISALANATGLERSTVGRNLQLLNKAGLVRMELGEDRRTKVVRLTAGGEAVINRATPLWQQVQGAIEGGLGNEQHAKLFTLLERIEALAPASPPMLPTASCPLPEPSRE